MDANEMHKRLYLARMKASSAVVVATELPPDLGNAVAIAEPPPDGFHHFLGDVSARIDEIHKRIDDVVRTQNALNAKIERAAGNNLPAVITPEKTPEHKPHKPR